ncbi:PAP2 superfamily protein [Pseudomonas aeruginosa]|nr:PAP2 superfamily protein [Pseudomonas aeruginosa]AWF64461.1 PAP2 superfamily protein [Pseudomonas aeruginosa]AZP57497.1 Membrane-associated phospholipid phosphatase [Pseudomonas aeruginosa]PRW15270.1 PAP2 superfamily protein [Pseudomonas aeruginosa]QJE75264.1 Membrane-associated phospholipid phosphatase [Pseudomonas aeruginosa]
MPFALALPFAARTAVLSRGDRRRALSAGPPTAPGRLPPAAAGGGLGCGRRRSRRGAGGATPAHAEQVRRVRAHDQWEDNVFPFAGDLLGASFDKERLPLTRSFFNRAQENLVEVLMPAKKHFARPRPYEVTPKVKPVLPPPEGESYPSGHTMDSYFKASLLSMLVPEHHDAFFARAEEHAQSRVLAGVHFPSDLEGGQTAAAALVASLLADPAVGADFAAVREELRGALGLPKLQ